MKKNRSTWSVLLSFVLAMVVMAGLAVTAFAETETDPDALEAVLNGTQKPTDGVNYDVDGNGIIEWDDLAALKGEQVDLLPNGETDLISLPLDPDYAEDADALQSLYVRGDSTIAIKYAKSDRNETLDWADPYVDFSNSAALVFDLFWPEEVGSLTLTIWGDDGKDYALPVPATQKGWSTVAVDLTSLPADNLTAVSGVYFERAVSGEKQTVYIDNMYLVSGTRVNFSTQYGSVDSKLVATGFAYGELPTLAHTFYNFEGWYLDQAYTKKVTADTIVTAEAEHTLYAKWSIVTSEDNSVKVTDKGNNAFGVTLDKPGYKQIRFQMKLDADPSAFALNYSFSDSTAGYYDNPIVVIMDENHKAVKAANVEADKWYTVVIYGTNDLYHNGSYNTQYTAAVPTSGTISIASDANAQIRCLEALSGQFGYRMYGAEIGWERVDLSAHGYSNGYAMHQNGASEWAARTEIAAQGGQYSAMTYDF